MYVYALKKRTKIKNTTEDKKIICFNFFLFISFACLIRESFNIVCFWSLKKIQRFTWIYSYIEFMWTNLWRLLFSDSYRCQCIRPIFIYLELSSHDKNFCIYDLSLICTNWGNFTSAFVRALDYLPFHLSNDKKKKKTRMHIDTWHFSLDTSVHIQISCGNCIYTIVNLHFLYITLITGNNWFSTINRGSACSLLIWWVHRFSWSRWTCTWSFRTFTSRGTPFSPWGPLC